MALTNLIHFNIITFLDITWNREIRKERLSSGITAPAPVFLRAIKRGFPWTAITELSI